MVARLVAEAFIPNTYNKPEVMHISNNNLDNSVSNLKWAFKSETRTNMYKKGSRKGRRWLGNKFYHNGKGFKSYEEFCKFNNITTSALSRRLRSGWSLDEIANTPLGKGRPSYYYEYYDDILTIKEISKITGTPVKLIHQRLNSGWSIYEAAEIAVGSN